MFKITSVSKNIVALCGENHGVEYFNTLFEVSDCVVSWVDDPTPEEIAAAAAAAACKECCTACHKYMTDKLAEGFVYGGNTYQVINGAQEDIGKRAIYAGWSMQDSTTFPWVEPHSLGWWDVSNAWHAMTAAEFMLFAKAVSDYVSACAACCRNHKNAITPANYSTYDYTTGWPVV